jgi:acyl-CoA dehydrogenase
MRVVVNHAMDVVAGRGVITGPRNFMARAYQAIPIAITVEGANILTRSLMVFGQGAIRCHPFIVEEIAAAGMENADEGAARLDSVFFRHIGHTTRNAMRSLLLALSGGLLETVPNRGNLQPYYRQLSRFSAAYSLLTDVTLLSIGGALKARQRLSGHMADCLVQLYYASAVIKQWHEEGYPESERKLIEWCLQNCLYELQLHLRELINNFPVSALRWPLRLLVFPLGSGRLRKPNDKLGAAVAMSIVDDGATRDRIVQGAYVSSDPSDALGRVLNAYRLANATRDIRDDLNAAIRKRDPDDLDSIALLMGHQRSDLVDWAVAQEIIDKEDREPLLEALNALYDVIRVDAFEAEGIKEMSAGVRGKRQVVERS